jgi:hypothetical protein
VRSGTLRTILEALAKDMYERGKFDPLDTTLAKQKIELLSPHKFNRKKLPTQDGRVLRRYSRRWKIERLFAWLQNYRRACSSRLPS